MAVHNLRAASAWFFSYYNRPEFRTKDFLSTLRGRLFVRISRALGEAVLGAKQRIVREWLT
jgi:hypothetical protein